MAGSPDTATIGGRVEAARRSRGLKSAAALADAVNEAFGPGFTTTRQTISALERTPSYRPHADLIDAIAHVLEIPADALRYGAPTGETFHITQLRTFEGVLEDYQWERLIWLAQDMAEEARARRAAESPALSLASIDEWLADPARTPEERAALLVLRAGLSSRGAPEGTQPQASRRRSQA